MIVKEKAVILRSETTKDLRPETSGFKKAKGEKQRIFRAEGFPRNDRNVNTNNGTELGDEL